MEVKESEHLEPHTLPATGTPTHLLDDENDRPGKRVKRSNTVTQPLPVPEDEDPRGAVSTDPNAPFNLTSTPRSRYLVLHQVDCQRELTAGEDHSKHSTSKCYLDVPRMFAKDSRGSALRGEHPVRDVDEYLENHPDICVLVYKTYNCTKYLQRIRDNFQKIAPETMNHSVFLHFRPWFYSLREDASPAKALTEYVEVVSVRLEDGLDKLTMSDPDSYTPWKEPANTAAPYDYFYHHQVALRRTAPQLLDAQSYEEVMVFLDYIQTSHGSQYADADLLFSQGYVTRKFFTKLFHAQEIILSNVEGGVQAYMIEKYEGKAGNSINLACWHWEFDGAFQRTKANIIVNWPNEDEDTVLITSLKAWPLRLDKTGKLEYLEERGSLFWKCRRRKLIRYAAPITDTFDIHSVRIKTLNCCAASNICRSTPST